MNSTSADWSLDFDGRGTMPAGRLLRAYLSEAKYEWIRTLRVPMFSVPILGFPIVFYLFFGILLGAKGGDPASALRQFVHWGVFSSVAPGMLGFGIALAFERQYGLLTFKRALPMPPAAYLLSKMLMSMLSVAFVMVALSAFAATLGGVHFTPGRLLELVAINAFGTLPFCAIGLFVGTWVNAQAAPAIVNVLYLPMALLSGAFFALPQSIATIEYVSPMFYLDQLGMWTVGLPSIGNPSTHVCVLAAITVIFTAISIRRLVRVG